MRLILLALACLLPMAVPMGCDPERSPANAGRAEGVPGRGEGSQGIEDDHAQPILFFYDANCPECLVVKEHLLEPFADHLGLTTDDVRWLPVTREEVARQILRLEKELGFHAPALAPILVAGGRAYCGLAAIRAAVEER